MTTRAIYCLICPEFGVVYVGKTKYPLDRKKAHLKGSDKTPIGMYQLHLLSKQKGLSFLVLDEWKDINLGYISKAENYYDLMEIYWIQQMRSWGFNLLNKRHMTHHRDLSNRMLLGI